MNPRALILPAIAFLVGLIALGVTALWVLAPRPGGETAASAVGGPFTLTSMNGERVTETSFAGAPFVVFFGFTHCPDVCPTTLMELSEIMRAAGDRGKPLKALFISVDPERDTPEVLKNYLGSFDGRIVGLTGTQEEIEGVVKAYRAYFRRVPTSGGDYTMNHTAIVYLMDRNGRFVGSLNIEGKPEDAAREWLRLL